MDYKEFIIEVLQRASGLAREDFNKVVGVAKPGDNNQVLTETDIKIGGMIIQNIQKEFPDYNIIDEEVGAIDRKSNFTWVVDPIDGTNNFAAGIPLFGIMIGLLDGGVPTAGGIALPIFSEIFIAQKGKGAYCNGKMIKVSKEENLRNSLVAYGIDGHQEDPGFTKRECELLAKIILSVRNFRSSNSVFDLCMVAKGKYGASLNRTTRIWDNVAPQIIIEEAGGIYTDFFGAAIDYRNPVSKIQDNFNYLTATSELHNQLLDILKPNL